MKSFLSGTGGEALEVFCYQSFSNLISRVVLNPARVRLELVFFL